MGLDASMDMGRGRGDKGRASVRANAAKEANEDEDVGRGASPLTGGGDVGVRNGRGGR
jgi:hypothetical protein